MARLALLCDEIRILAIRYAWLSSIHKQLYSGYIKCIYYYFKISKLSNAISTQKGTAAVVVVSAEPLLDWKDETAVHWRQINERILLALHRGIKQFVVAVNMIDTVPIESQKERFKEIEEVVSSIFNSVCKFSPEFTTLFLPVRYVLSFFLFIFSFSLFFFSCLLNISGLLATNLIERSLKWFGKLT